jgi:hypothetical protein
MAMSWRSGIAMTTRGWSGHGEGLMSGFYGVHNQLRQEWMETPPDLSYQFVVSFDTLRAAGVAYSATFKKKMRWWARALRYFVVLILKSAFAILIVGLMLWLPYQASVLVDRLSDATQRLGGNAIVSVITFLITLVALSIGLRIVGRRLNKRPTAHYHEFYAGNEFIVEARKSHLWFAERSAGAIRRWSTFEQVVEFEEGMWLLLRRSTTFAALRGLLIARESLPGSCDWNDLKAYVRQRIEEAAANIEA